MGKASSAKKVARAARAGGSTKKRTRNWGFPLGIVAIIVVGVLVIFVAYDRNTEAAAVSPTTTEHWHAAYGIYVCDAFLPAVADGPTDLAGIHTHADGIIHIHPLGSAAGKNAKLEVFAEQVGMSFSSDGFTMPDGTEYKNGYDCNGTPAVVTISQWNNADELLADPNAPPDVVYTDDFGSIRFTLAVAPEGTTIPGPESLATLNNLSDVAPSSTLDLSQVTPSSSTTVAGGTESTQTTLAAPTSSTTITVP
jgi:hypothetical protein